MHTSTASTGRQFPARCWGGGYSLGPPGLAVVSSIGLRRHFPRPVLRHRVIPDPATGERPPPAGRLSIREQVRSGMSREPTSTASKDNDGLVATGPAGRTEQQHGRKNRLQEDLPIALRTRTHPCNRRRAAVPVPDDPRPGRPRGRFVQDSDKRPVLGCVLPKVPVEEGRPPRLCSTAARGAQVGWRPGRFRGRPPRGMAVDSNAHAACGSYLR